MVVKTMESQPLFLSNRNPLSYLIKKGSVEGGRPSPMKEGA